MSADVHYIFADESVEHAASRMGELQVRNRVILEVADLPSHIASLKEANLHFRNEMETGPGGRQILLEDPDGNPIELFEPAHKG